MTARDRDNEELEKLHREFRSLQLMAYAMIGMVVLVIVVSVMRIFLLTFLFLAAAVLFQLFVFRRKQKEYTTHVMQEKVRRTIGPLLGTDEVKTDGSADLRAEMVAGSELVPVIKKEGTVNFYAAVSGQTGAGNKKMKVTASDVTIAVPALSVKGGAEILCGNWVHIDMAPEGAADGYDIKVRNGNLPAGTGGAALPARFSKQLAELVRFTPGKVHLRVLNGNADVFIQDRFLDAGFSPRADVTPALLERNPLPELEKVLDLIWTLRNTDR